MMRSLNISSDTFKFSIFSIVEFWENWNVHFLRNGFFPQHNAKLAVFENNRLITIGEQKDTFQNFYNLLLTEFRHKLYTPNRPDRI